MMTTETLFAKLKKDSAWPLLDVLKPMAPESRVNAMWRWCLMAAQAHEDDKACQLYEGLMLAIDDACGGAQSETAQSRRTDVAIEVYGVLPEFLKSRECVDRESGETADVRYQTLVNLKKRILADAAHRWATAKDDDVAWPLASFFVEVAKTRDVHVLERLNDALKEATKRVWKKDRALALMTRFVSETQVDGEKNPARTLLIGVMRTFNSKDILTLALLLIQLPFDTMRGGYDGLSGEAVFAAVERDAEEYRQLHVVMTELRKALKVERGNIQAFAPSYPRAGQVELTIIASPTFAPRGEEENGFHDLAAALRNQAQDWLNARQASHQDAPAVKLTVQWPTSPYAASDAPPRFQRLFELHTPKS